MTRATDDPPLPLAPIAIAQLHVVGTASPVAVRVRRHVLVNHVPERAGEQAIVKVTIIADGRSSRDQLSLRVRREREHRADEVASKAIRLKLLVLGGVEGNLYP